MTTANAAAALKSLRIASDAANAYAAAARSVALGGDRSARDVSCRAAMRASQLRAALWSLSK